MYTSGEFILHRSDTPFASRQKVLFDELLIAERGCKRNRAIPVSEEAHVEIEEPRRKMIKIGINPGNEFRKFRGKESIFKRPVPPAPRTRIQNIPDHHKNPHKWTKYSLEDVSNEDMTDKSNTQAALSFLKELKARKQKQQKSETEQEMDIDETESVEKKGPFKQRNIKVRSQIRFQKPETDNNVDGESSVIIDYNDGPVFRSSKIIMPEYVVGQKPKRNVKKDKPKEKTTHRKELKLDHLEEPDGEEEESS